LDPGFPFKLELSLARPPADKNEAQELEGFRLSEPALLKRFAITGARLGADAGRYSFIVSFAPREDP
jgi:hypothetical protein